MTIFVAAITDDPLGIVLAIGVLVSASSAVVYFTSRSAKAAPKPAPQRSAPRELMSASSTLARAQATARERSAAAASADGYRLTDVRPVRPAPAYPERTQRPERAPQPQRPAGQAPPQPDREESDRTEATARARAIAFHIAEHDPQRMAEVIRSWIRSDMTKKAENS